MVDCRCFVDGRWSCDTGRPPVVLWPVLEGEKSNGGGLEVPVADGTAVPFRLGVVMMVEGHTKEATSKGSGVRGAYKKAGG